MPDSFARPLQKIVVTLPLSRRTIERSAALASRVVPSMADRVAFQQTLFGQHAQYPQKNFAMRFHIDQTARS